MAHIVYCWEMGGGLGHVMPLAQISAEMISQGHQVSCILKDVAHAPRLLHPLGVNWYPAPKLRRIWKSNRPLINHADILIAAGYDTYDNFYGLLGAWRSLFSLLKPDRVVCEYSPTAVLAARSLSLDVVCIDSGFSMPPLSDNPEDPLPPILGDLVGPDSRCLAASERRVLEIVNSAFASLRVRPLDAFSYIFREKVWYRNWHELNHFGPHSQEKHLGPILNDKATLDPTWPLGAGPKLFAYLKPECTGSVPVLKAALALGYRIVAYLPGFSKQVIDELSRGGRLIASSRPFRLSNLPNDVEIGLWHSPTGAVAHCLAKDIRMVFLPMHPEQEIACNAVRRLGLPAYITRKSEDWPAVFETLRALPSVREEMRLQPANVRLFASTLTNSPCRM